jgi:hypothetical protein
MRKLIMMAVAGFVWKKIQARLLKQQIRNTPVRRG